MRYTNRMASYDRNFDFQFPESQEYEFLFELVLEIDDKCY